MKQYILLIVTILVFLATSCQKEDAYNGNEGEGGFSLAIKVDDSKTTATRAALAPDALRAGASVKIYLPLNKGLIREYTYGTMPEVVYLPASTENYRVDVAAGEIVRTTGRRKANFEQKSYKGSAEFSVTAGEVTSGVAVTAKICNAITNATFNSTIAENFKEGYTLTFALKEDAVDEDKLVYTVNESGKDGYFIIDNAALEKALYWTFVGELTDGTAVTKSGKIEPKDSEGNAVSLAGAKMTMNFKYTVKDGFLLFDLQVNDTISEEDTKQDIIGWAPVSTGIIPLVEGDPNIWAKFVTVSADVDTGAYDADKVYFQYRKQGDTEWSAISDNIKAAATAKEGVYSAVLKGLEPNTQYEYQLVLFTKETTTTNDAGETVTVPAVMSVIGDENGDGNADTLATFTTDSTPQIPNGDFEVTSNTESSKYISFYKPDYTDGDPNTDDSQYTTKWWDSGNKASADFNLIICNKDTGVVGENCAYLTCRGVNLGVSKILAAGNLFSGTFVNTEKTSNGIVNFGRKFEGRPTGITFYIKYKGGQVDVKSDGDPLNIGDYDQGQFKVALGYWPVGKYITTSTDYDQESPIQVRTAYPNTFWDIETLDETIVYKDIIMGDSDGDGQFDGGDSGWMKVTWKFDYTQEDVFPTHIIVSGASSRYGDYFNGYSGSEMWLDNIKLLYDHPDMITEEIVKVQ